MTSRRHWIALIAVIAGFGELAIAQDTGATSAGSETTGSSTSTPATTPPATAPPATTPPATTPAATESAGAASSFGTPVDGTGGLGATSGGEPAGGTSTSNEGLGFGSPKVPDSAPSFTLPGFYGSSATTYTAGSGRLARPRFRYSVSMAVGYDDNILQTPTTPGPGQEVLVELPTPDTVEPIVETRTRIGQGGLPQQFQVVVGFRTVPGRPARFQTIQPPERIGSFFTRGTFALDMQIFTRRSLFTFDANVGADHYFGRPTSDATDYNGGITLNYLYRVSPRLQATAQLNAAYLSQPDFNRINTPDSLTVGPYLNSNARFDLSYRWTPRITSLLSLTDNLLHYEEPSQQGGNYNDVVLGIELRYLWSPRFTFLGEARYSNIIYEQNSALNSNTAYLLLGSEFKMTQRMSGSVRLGSSMRTFKEAAASSSTTSYASSSTTPYAELTLAYRLTTASAVNWYARFGFEEPFAPGDERVVLRSGLTFVQAFSTRLQAALGVTFLHETNTSTLGLESTSDLLDANLRLDYKITKRFSLNATYSYTQRKTTEQVLDYYRNRLFLGGQYNF